MKDGYVYIHRVVALEKFGEFSPDMVVHHVDENKENWNPENLELLPRATHTRMHKTTGTTTVVLECPVCTKSFERKRNQTHLVKKRNKTTCCSRSCAAARSNGVMV